MTPGVTASRMGLNDSATPPSAPWGARLRAFRKDQLGLSQDKFAIKLREAGAEWGLNIGCDQRLVARWENGDVKMPSQDYVELLVSLGAPVPAAALDMSEASALVGVGSNALLKPPAASGSFAAVEDVRGASFLEAVASATVGSPDSLAPWLPPFAKGAPIPTKVGIVDVRSLHDITTGLRGLDQRHGGFAVADTAVALLKSNTGLLTGCRNETTAAKVKVALADLARLAGWSIHDVGDQDRARRYLALALVLAREARSHSGDSLAASTLYVLGRISLFEREPQVALRMFQLGQIPAQDASNSGESARLYMQEAWAHAMMGRERQMKDALARAEQGIRTVGDTVDPWTQVFFTAGEFDGNTSVIYNEFALATDDTILAERYTIAAVDRASASLESSSPDRSPRSLLFDHTTEATGRFRLRDTDSAVQSATAALSMTGEVQSARVVDRLHSMTTAAAPSLQRSGVRDVCRQVRQLALPGPRT
ncbi:helix-turn-helix domain-containing protein [Nocardia nepalensis]|uniref:helix-turn-helix domain-containing protein n=1 Tax=Nocardia nepalensis TaxID=3375448 RepID=UPI003B67DB73